MSVINKMLRDLDSRQSAATNPASSRPIPPGFTEGTVLVTPLKPVVRVGLGLRSALLILAVTLLVLGVAAVWWSQYSKATPHLAEPQKPFPVALNPPATATVAPVMAPKASSVVLPPVPVAVMARLTPAPVVVQPSTAMPMTLQLKLATVLKTLPTTSTSTPSLPPKAELPPVRVSQLPRPSPALDALAQAQSLWTAGSHAAALELLREALALSERANVAGAPAPTTAVLASLARELARMEMAEGHVSQALALLTRLEPSLSGEAEVWALRGNAAQRLGRHEESAESYQRALRLRPKEARWMLGAAVSLAALGKTESAADYAEKARLGGALTPELATYLKQLGVALK